MTYEEQGREYRQTFVRAWFMLEMVVKHGKELDSSTSHTAERLVSDEYMLWLKTRKGTDKR